MLATPHRHGFALALGLVLCVACGPHVDATRIVDGKKVTIVLDDDWPLTPQACPHAAPLSSGVVDYIEDYTRANLCEHRTCEPEVSDDATKGLLLDVQYESEASMYCVLLAGMPDGLHVTLKRNGGWQR